VLIESKHNILALVVGKANKLFNTPLLNRQGTMFLRARQLQYEIPFFMFCKALIRAGLLPLKEWGQAQPSRFGHCTLTLGIWAQNGRKIVNKQTNSTKQCE
jgi:hypothetical protein